MPKYPFAEWVAEQLRLTVFTLPGAANPALEQWWTEVVGSPPDESTANIKLGLKSLAGSFNSGKLILKLELDRIDWLYVPQDPDLTSGVLPALPSIGPITENLGLFSEIAERWLGREDIPEIVRIAFGSVVTHPEQDHRSAYNQISEYLPLKLNPDSSDFNFQINIPTVSNSGIDHLRINRLSRWGVVRFARVAFRIDSARVSTSPQLTDYALRLEIDINTSPELEHPLPKERLAELYRELVALGSKIMTEGLPQ